MVCVPQYKSIPDEQVRNKSDRAAVDSGCTWQPARGERFCSFVETYIRTTRGISAGQPVTLQDWQRDLSMRLFSWIKPDNYRRFRAGFLGIPRQNGKSFYATCLALYMLMADGESGSYVTVSACKSKQTRVVYDEVVSSIRASPKLSAATLVRESYIEIYYPKKQSSLKGLSSDGWGQLGLPPHLACCDEFSFWRNYKAYEALKTGMDSRKQPLLFCISTSGTDRSTQGYDLWKYATAVEQGLLEDQAFCGVVYAAPPEADIHSEETWRKCNPSLGVTVPLAETKAWSDRAKNSKVEELQFRQYRLNQWTTSTNQFLNLDRFKECTETDWPDLKGLPAYVGVDLSCTTDLTSVVAVIPYKGRFYVDHHSFCCRSGVERTEAQNLVKYRLFEFEKSLTVHDGNCIDYDDVRTYIRSLSEKYKIQSIAVDPSMNAAETLLILQGWGMPVVQYRQGALNFNAPMTRLSELVNDQKLAHRGDSLILWQAQNLESKRDSRDMICPSKPSGEAKIDTLVATIMALARCMEGQAAAIAAASRPVTPFFIDVW
jgi:phage terminase large subunit-like protein